MMMKITKLFSICAILFLLNQSYAADADAKPEPPKLDAVQEIMQAWMTQNNVPGATVALYINGQPKFYYFGYANRDKKTPVTKDTVFEIGSITKVMTSIILADNVDGAKLQLKTPVRKYLPNLPASFTGITLGQLATHTAGLPFNPPTNIKTKDGLNEYLATWHKESNAQPLWMYSNIGIGLLGSALQNATHKSMDQLYQHYIFAPLKMPATALTATAQMQKNYAQGYDSKDAAVPAIDSGFFPASTALKSSAEDMQHFLSAAIGLPGTPESVLYPVRMTQSAYVEMPFNTQGLGWQIHSMGRNDIADLLDAPAKADFGPIEVIISNDKAVFDGDMLIDKTGGTNGFRSYIGVIPNKKAGIVILANKSVSNSDIVNVSRDILFQANNIQWQDGITDQ